MNRLVPAQGVDTSWDVEECIQVAGAHGRKAGVLELAVALRAAGVPNDSRELVTQFSWMLSRRF